MHNYIVHYIPPFWQAQRPSATGLFERRFRERAAWRFAPGRTLAKTTFEKSCLQLQRSTQFQHETIHHVLMRSTSVCYLSCVNTFQRVKVRNEWIRLRMAV